MFRFIHTSDWQLGMTRRFLSAEAQARFSDARIQAIRTIGVIARDQGASFVVVAGDVFESNMVDRQIVLRALDAMKEAAVPFYLLPGNHDPLGPGSVWESAAFGANQAANVVVLTGIPVEPISGVTLLSAPWRSKRFLADPIAAACAQAAEASGFRLLVGHGRCEIFAPDEEHTDLIRLQPAEAALAANTVHYIALGDRHSRTAVGASGRIWYCGTPEPTEYRESDPGHVLLVEAAENSIAVEALKVATWHFQEELRFAINDAVDVGRLRALLEAIPGKERTVLNLGLHGTVSLALMADVDAAIEHYRPMFAAIERRDSDTDLFVVPSETDLSALAVSGFAATAARELASSATGNTPEATEARDALRLLHRLSRGAA